MPDKKVSKSVASRPLTPSQKLEASLSDSGTVNMAEPAHDRARSALVDKFKEREERWRREQSMGQPGEAVSAEKAAAVEEAEAVEEAVPAGEGEGTSESDATRGGGGS